MCLASCNVIRSIPEARTWRFQRADVPSGSSGRPSSRRPPRPESSYAVPHSRRSVICCAAHSSRVLIVTGSRFTVRRPRPVLVGPSMTWPPRRDRWRINVMASALRSMSDHRRPISSPRRAPLISARRHRAKRRSSRTWRMKSAAWLSVHTLCSGLFEAFGALWARSAGLRGMSRSSTASLSAR